MKKLFVWEFETLEFLFVVRGLLTDRIPFLWFDLYLTDEEGLSPEEIEWIRNRDRGSWLKWD